MSITIPTWTTGDRIRKAREGVGYSQADLANRLGVGLNTIRRWERDRSPAKRMALVAIALECNVPVEWLEGTDGEAVTIGYTSWLAVAA